MLVDDQFEYTSFLRKEKCQYSALMPESEKVATLFNIVQDLARRCNPGGGLDMDYVPTHGNSANEHAWRLEKGYPVFEQYFDSLDWTGPREIYFQLLNDTLDKDNGRPWLVKALAKNTIARFVCQLLRAMNVDDLKVLTQDASTLPASVVKAIQKHQRSFYRFDHPFDVAHSERPVHDFLRHWQLISGASVNIAAFASDVVLTHTALQHLPPDPADDVLARRARITRHKDVQNALFGQLVMLAKNNWNAQPYELALPDLGGIAP